MKSQIIIEVCPKNNNTHLSNVNGKLEAGWFVKQVLVCNDNSIHYLLEKGDSTMTQEECMELHKNDVNPCSIMKDNTILRTENEDLKRIVEGYREAKEKIRKLDPFEFHGSGYQVTINNVLDDVEKISKKD